MIAYIWLYQQFIKERSLASSSVPSIQLLAKMPSPSPQLGERHQLSYQQWVALLKKEAEVAAENQPEDLFILLGDSISLWFPPQLLPSQENWLNQGISGETSLGLLKRLELLDQTKPKAIFLMIGINDLLQDIQDDIIIANQRLTIRYLKKTHPQTKIIVQSILPHSGEKSTWEGRDRLLKIPNERIQNINRRLKAISNSEEVIYLDLYLLFADEQGNLKTELTTDGLHLSSEGYKMWRTALQVVNQLTCSHC